MTLDLRPLMSLLSDQRNPPGRRYAAMIALAAVPAVLSFFLCLHGLSEKPLWLDEVITYNRSNLPVPELIVSALHSKQLPPYFLLEKLFDRPTVDEWTLRFPSVVFMSMSVFFIGLIASEITMPIAGLFAGSFAALAPITVEFGQEARPYALVELFIFIALWGLLRIIRDAPAHEARTALPSPRIGWAAYAFGTLAALSTFLVSVIWFLCANIVMGAFFLSNVAPRRLLRKWLVLQIPIVLPLICVAIGIYFFSGHDPFDGHGWVPPSTLSHVQSVLSAAYFLRISDVSSFALVNSQIAWLGTAGAILVCFGAYHLRAQHKVSTLLIAATMAMPIALFVISLFHPFWVTRYLLWSTGPYFILAGIGLASAPRYASMVLATTVLIAEFINLAPYYSSDTKPRWDTAAEYLAKRSSGEPIVTNDKAAKYVLSAYSRRYGLEPSNITTGPDLPSNLAGSGIWIVYGRTGQGATLSEDDLLRGWSKLGKPIEHANFGRDVSVLYLGRDVGSARADVAEDGH